MQCDLSRTDYQITKLFVWLSSWGFTLLTTLFACLSVIHADYLIDRLFAHYILPCIVVTPVCTNELELCNPS